MWFFIIVCSENPKVKSGTAYGPYESFDALEAAKITFLGVNGGNIIIAKHQHGYHDLSRLSCYFTPDELYNIAAQIEQLKQTPKLG